MEIVPVGPAIGRKFAVLVSLLKGNGNSKWWNATKEKCIEFIISILWKVLWKMDFLFTGIIPNYREIINWSGIIIWSGKITLFENWNIYIYIYIYFGLPNVRISRIIWNDKIKIEKIKRLMQLIKIDMNFPHLWHFSFEL